MEAKQLYDFLHAYLIFGGDPKIEVAIMVPEGREGELVPVTSASLHDIFYQNTDGDPQYYATKPGEKNVIALKG